MPLAQRAAVAAIPAVAFSVKCKRRSCGYAES